MGLDEDHEGNNNTAAMNKVGEIAWQNITERFHLLVILAYLLFVLIGSLSDRVTIGLCSLFCYISTWGISISQERTWQPVKMKHRSIFQSDKYPMMKCVMNPVESSF